MNDWRTEATREPSFHVRAIGLPCEIGDHKRCKANVAEDLVHDPIIVLNDVRANSAITSAFDRCQDSPLEHVIHGLRLGSLVHSA
jgi:hypothetical protein